MNGDRGIYLENGGWGSDEAGCLKAQDIDKFIQWTPFLEPFLCFESTGLVTHIAHVASV